MTLLIIICLIVILLISSLPRGMCGFWVCSDEFANSAGIDRLWITFGSLDMKMRTPGYILLQRDGQVILNEPVVVSFKMRTPFSNSQRIKLLNFEADGMPDEFTIKKEGANKIKMYNKKTLWGVFYKDNEKSDMCYKN